ncbi:beta-galactosidase GalA [Asticcacaulis taihuensis]|uniref:beta-galactosidase GalA n=1 Tax=Asticcacaulis taihuensis TaxID=260084 RepID=UPI0026F36F29|nr:beta-galactosidase GalA [Asticcacaulis taihuensis]
MNRRELFKSASALAVVGLLPQVAIAGTNGPDAADKGPRETLLLDKGWRFHDGDIAMPVLITHDQTYNAAKAGRALGAASPAYDDSDWTEVTLPHDFVSFQPIENGTNVDQGYRRRGIVWYRNHLKFSDADRGKHIELQLDGIATFATIWFNGTLVARNWSGYNSTYIDLTPYVTYGDSDNALVVRVDATAMEGWWYEGGGIYRDAWIVKRNPVHIVTDGVFAHPVKEGDEWQFPFEVTVYNSGKAEAVVDVVGDIIDPQKAGSLDGAIAKGWASVKVPPLGSLTVNIPMTRTGLYQPPRLWSIEKPELYWASAYIVEDGKWRENALIGGHCLDSTQINVGFRTQRFDAKTGFYLNDKPLKIKGVCLHQDHAGVGCAVPDGVLDFRLRRLKELGANSIRFSHNAQNKALMDACDRHGFLVMAENRNFNASPDYLEQLEWLVRRDRNHPSVFLWSVFNEEPMQGTEQGYEMVRRMSAVVKALDTSRPVTAAMNDGLFTALNVSDAVDVVGINYQQHQYDAFHAAHPDIPMFSSEDTSAFMTRGEYKTDAGKHIMASYDDDAAPWGETHRAAWKEISARPFVAGTFVWTGFDYHGEPTPHTWPTNSSFFGIMDLCGFEKTAFYIHQAQWIDDRPVLGLAPHWNWQKGQKVRVVACSNLDEVELFVNGKSAGKQTADRLNMNYWTVDYAPGFIEVRGYKGGKVVRKTRNETTGKAVALRLVKDRPTLIGDGRDAMPIRVEAIDAKGRVVPDANHKVTFGGTATIIGLGNGDPNCLEAEKGDTRSLFNGLAQVIIQAPEMAGNATTVINLTARAESLKPANIEIRLDAPKAATLRQPTMSPMMVLDSWFRAPDATTHPDPNQKAADTDMNSWAWFRPGELFGAAKADGYSLVAANYTPFASIQKNGGRIVFTSITGACDIYLDGQAVGRKDDPAPAALTVAIPPFVGSRRLSLVFKLKAGEPFGFAGLIRIGGPEKA